MNDIQQSRGGLVVVGASAGGIEALSILVAGLRPDFPAPVVLAQHLDPTRPSFLASVLERRSGLPIVGVEGRTALEAGRVYVVPSNRHVVIEDGHLNLEADHAQRPRPSVDLLLSTAAAAYGDRLVAVILTGAGSDGAAGAVDVKDAGGVVVIQNPLTARYPSMPLALPPTAVDHVVDIEKIGPLLVDILNGVETTAEGPRPDDDALRQILGQLGRRSNVDFRPYKPGTILRRIGRRMAITHTHSLQEYSSYLDAHPEEVGELVMALLIKVTEFFRDPEAFAFLQRTVLPGLVNAARDRGRTLRLWSAGCATGEEAYSLALMVADLLGPELPDWNVKVFATDLDEGAVAFARRGLYPANVLKNLPPHYLERYFEPYDQGQRVGKSLRQLVIFGQQDLGRGVPFPRMDLVVCRNLLIYFKPELQQDVLDLFAYSLHPTHGYLFLGKAETARPSKSTFELVNKRWKVYRCLNGPMTAPRQLAGQALPAPGEGAPEARRGRSAWPGGAEHSRPAALEADLAYLRRYNELVNRHVPIGLIVVNRQYRIVSINSAARRLLGIREIANDQDFLHTTRALPYADTRRAIDVVLRERAPISLPNLPLDPAVKSDAGYVTLHFSAMSQGDDREYAVVSVQDVTEVVNLKRELESMAREHRQLTEDLGVSNRRLAEMNKELQESNEELQAANEELMLAQEELQATNEEFEATNEELQASNEELETNNEELQATNEELETTNEELQARSSELQELTRILSTERARLGEVVELSPFFTMVITGPDLRIESSSPAEGGLFGSREVLGHPFADVARAADLNVLLDAVEQVRSHDRTWTSEPLPTPTANAQGGPLRIRDLMYTVVPTHAPEGHVDGAVIYAEDVTLRKAREDEQQRERLRLMMEHAAQVALALYDARTRALLHASPHYLELVRRVYDVPRDRVLGRPWEELSLLGDEAAVLFSAVRDTGQPRHIQEVRVHAARGETFWDCSLIPIPARAREGSSDVRYLVVSAVEVTGQVEAREELKKVDQLKDQFLSLASHELRTPLVPLRTYTEILSQRAESQGDEELGAVVAKFEKQLLHLTRLTDDLLDVARLENGKLHLELGPVDLRQIAREAASRLAVAHGGVDVRLVLPEEPAMVLADEDRLVQVLSNLLDNAVRHGQSSRIDLRVLSHGGAAAVVEVEDYGVGIPAAEHASIFDRLHQAALPHRASRPGLGLGLFIARELVEQHGGTLTVASDPGRGSTFTVRLPLLEEQG